MSQVRRSKLCLQLLAIAGVIVVSSNCGKSSTANVPVAAGLRGVVHGGQQGVTGASIALYAAGSTGYGLPNLSILTSTVTTGAEGSFSITGLYTCPSPSSQMYLVATGGNSGSGTNSSLALMAALGDCSALSSSTFVTINEVTTVGAVYALAAFMATNAETPGGSLGASSTNTQGITQAFTTAKNLVDTVRGTAPGASLPASAIVPVEELNTLADIIATCVNSNDSSGECSTLFTDVTPGGGTAPANTIDALLDIVQNPSNNVSALNNLVTGTAPFQPTIESAPNDWMVAISYNDGVLFAPSALVVDSGGNIWVASTSGNSLSEFSNNGTVLSGVSGYTGGGLSGPRWAAIDNSGNIWITNANDSLSEFDSSGNALSGTSGYTGGGLSSPQGLAVYNSSGIFVMDNANSYTQFSEFQLDGTVKSGSPFTKTGISSPYGVALTNGGTFLWITNPATHSLDQLITSSLLYIRNVAFAGGLNAPQGIAIDGSGNVWVADSGGADLTEYSGTGIPISGSSGYTGGGVLNPSQIAIDGLNHVWVTNPAANCVSEFSNSGTALSGDAGFTGGALSTPQGVGIDGSGNVWVANSNANNIVEFVGAGAPVVTPLASAVTGSKLGTRP